MDKALKNKLQKLFDVVMEEAETNEKFAKKLEETMRTVEDKSSGMKVFKIPEDVLLVDIKDVPPEAIEKGKTFAEKFGELKVSAEESDKSTAQVIVVDGKKGVAVHTAILDKPATKKKNKTIMVPNVRGNNRRDKAVLDPIKLTEEGDPNLRKKLERLTEKQLKDIIADYGMDPSKLAMKWKDRDRLIQLIMETSARRATKGDAFRNMD